ncbi:hypothetical protein FNSP4_18380 [Fusobacterium nucleatum]|mgnify:CR=1 FL=1|nr:hypothetical protein FNCP4_12410 [Fusobacterium nucleatum]BEP04104.1 hypothetical protein FNSP4_18380 [Fusobacterium nucleatum]
MKFLKKIGGILIKAFILSLLTTIILIALNFIDLGILKQ